MIDRGIWFIITVSWLMNIIYVVLMFSMIFYSIADGINLFIK